MNTSNIRDIVELLSRTEDAALQELFSHADEVRRTYMGEGILLRGIVEFSNHCRNTCYYCGLNKNNTALPRYRMSSEEVLAAVDKIAECRMKTVVLQSGEEDSLDPRWLAELVAQIKSRHADMAVTLCVGERPEAEYALWKDAGADRYLLKIETANRKLYESLHPGMSFEHRVQCLRALKKLGYQTGSGGIIGLKGQTLETIAEDILFYKSFDFEMIGIGPFIPHRQTPLAEQLHGEVALTLKALAVTRIAVRTPHLPATTALGSLEKDYRLEGLKAGANVIMPNFTPVKYRKLYEIYPGKKCIEEKEGACVGCMEAVAKSLGRFIDYSRGDAIKRPPSAHPAQEEAAGASPSAGVSPLGASPLGASLK
jgi:biotin synthase